MSVNWFVIDCYDLCCPHQCLGQSVNLLYLVLKHLVLVSQQWLLEAKNCL